MKIDPWENAVAQLTEVRRYLPMNDEEFSRLLTHDRVVEKTLDLKLAGKRKRFSAFRAQHNKLLGPYKGGIRFHPSVTREEVMALSMWMTWKTAVAGLPLGGGKGGVQVDPKSLNRLELEQVARAWVREFVDVIGPEVDIPAPDVNTDPEVMTWMVDECVQIHQGDGRCRVGKKCGVCESMFTGKPLDKGGSAGRVEATGRGGFLVLEAAIKKIGKIPESTTVAVQGLGNVGFWFAKFAVERGYRVVAVSDSKGGVLLTSGENSQSLDVDDVLAYKLNNQGLEGYPNSKKISNEELLELGVDVLVPAALENVITGENADKIKAEVIVEMANGPMTTDAERMLVKKRKVIIPDILANSGGVTVSYFEWVQNTQGQNWSIEKVNDRLEKQMSTAFEEVWREWQKLLGTTSEVSLRTAAYVVAVGRVLKAMRQKK